MDQDLGDQVRRAAHGDRGALERVLRRVDARVLHLCHRLLGNAEDARDVRQWVLLKLTRSLHTLSAGNTFDATFHTWLHCIAVNACRDRLRERASQARLLGRVEDELRGRSLSRAHPSDAAERDEQGARVASIVAELSVDEREVLVLRHYEGLAFPQIARILGAPETTLKSRFARALESVAQRLGELEERAPRERTRKSN